MSFGTLDNISLAHVRGGVAHRSGNPFVKQMELERGMSTLRSLITAAGGQPPPPVAPDPQPQPRPHPFQWSVGFIR